MWKTGQLLGSVLLRGGGGCRGAYDATHRDTSNDDTAAMIFVAPLLEEPVDLILFLSTLHKHRL